MVVDAVSLLSATFQTPNPPTGSLLIRRETMTRQGTSKTVQTKAMKTVTTEIKTISRHPRGMAKPVDNTKGTKKKHGPTDTKNTSRISVGVRTMTIIEDRTKTMLLATTKTTKLATKARVTTTMATNAIVMTSAGRLSSDTQPIRSGGLTLATKKITISPTNAAAVRSTPTSTPTISISGTETDAARTVNSNSIVSLKDLNRLSSNESFAIPGPTTKPETTSSIKLANGASSSRTNDLDKRLNLHIFMRMEEHSKEARITQTVEASPIVVEVSNTAGMQKAIANKKIKLEFTSPGTTKRLRLLTTMKFARFRMVST
jgi:hypothetical protein